MATASKRKRGDTPRSAGDLAALVRKIIEREGPNTRSRLENLVREAGWSFSSTAFGHALDRYGAAHGLEVYGKRPQFWRLKAGAPAAGYGPDPAPNGNAHWPLKPADLDAEPPAPNGNGKAHGLENVPELALALGIAPVAKGHTVNARIPLLRDVINAAPAIEPEQEDGTSWVFPHPDRVEEPELEPTVEVSPVNGVTFPACDGRGSWVVMGSRDEPASLLVVPPRGPSMGLTVSSAVALADALRRVASQAAVRLREAQAAGGD